MNRSISKAVLLRGSYIDDIRHFSRDRKLPSDALIRFLLTMTDGTLSRELYDAGIEMAASSFIDRRKGVDNSCFWNLMKHFNDLCDDPATLKDYRLWAIDGSTIPCPRNPDSSNHFKSKPRRRTEFESQDLPRISVQNPILTQKGQGSHFSFDPCPIC